MALIISLSIIGLILIIVEIILIPGIFITGVLGLAAIVASCYISFTSFGQTAGIIVSSANIVLGVTCIVLSLRSKTWRKLSLKTEIDSKTDSTPVDKGIEIGSTGKTITRLNPMGKAMFGETAAEVTARNGIIDPNSIIEVVLIEDNKIYVKLK